MDLDRVERLLKLFGASRAQELVVEAEGWCVSVKRGIAPPVGAPTSPPSLTAAELLAVMEPAAPQTALITAPLVGIFRQNEVRLEVGDYVRAGSPVGSIESMKILNPVLAEISGQVEEVFVEEGHPVAYGQPLYTLLPLGDQEEEEEA
jgi:acetyl-CoA carboxylase biotin carboxyl carrier protein